MDAAHPLWHPLPDNQTYSTMLYPGGMPYCYAPYQQDYAPPPRAPALAHRYFSAPPAQPPIYFQQQYPATDLEQHFGAPFGTSVDAGRLAAAAEIHPRVVSGRMEAISKWQQPFQGSTGPAEPYLSHSQTRAEEAQRHFYREQSRLAGHTSALPVEQSFASFQERGRASERPLVEERSMAARPSEPTAVITYDLISNAAFVPPPPSVENSAVPLTDFATNFVWETVRNGLDSLIVRSPVQSQPSANKTPSLYADIMEANGRLRQSSTPAASPNRQRSYPATPELFGTIGDRRQRKLSDDGGSSDSSSPSSSAPGTPAGIDAIDAAALRKQRLSGLGLLNCGDSDLKHDGYDRENAVEALRFQARQLSAAHKSPVSPTTSLQPSPSLHEQPTPAFRHFVRQILTATLLSPEDLALALFYVASVPATSLLPTPPPEHAQSLSFKANAVKAAPFRLVLAGLMLANKTLQDNSYRNETFASVSGLPLADVNSLELHLYAALSFSINVRNDPWRQWLGVLVERARSVRDSPGRSSSTVVRALEKLWNNAQLLGVPVAFRSPTTSSNSAGHTVPARQSRRDLAELDLDDAGPLKNPAARHGVRAYERSFHYESTAPTACAKAAYPISQARAFGHENLDYNRWAGAIVGRC